jgi:RecG-like helicase
MDAGWQCALMAPTEILAEQHFRKLIGWLEPLGITRPAVAGSPAARSKKGAHAPCWRWSRPARRRWWWAPMR